MNRHPNARVGPSLFSMGGLFFPSHLAVVFDDPSLSFVFLFSFFFFFSILAVFNFNSRRGALEPSSRGRAFSRRFVIFFSSFCSFRVERGLTRGWSRSTKGVTVRLRGFDFVLFSFFSVLHDDDGWMEKTRGSRALAATQLSSQ